MIITYLIETFFCFFVFWKETFFLRENEKGKKRSRYAVRGASAKKLAVALELKKNQRLLRPWFWVIGLRPCQSFGPWSSQMPFTRSPSPRFYSIVPTGNHHEILTKILLCVEICKNMKRPVKITFS